MGLKIDSQIVTLFPNNAISDRNSRDSNSVSKPPRKAMTHLNLDRLQLSSDSPKVYSSLYTSGAPISKISVNNLQLSTFDSLNLPDHQRKASSSALSHRSNKDSQIEGSQNQIESLRRLRILKMNSSSTQSAVEDLKDFLSKKLTPVQGMFCCNNYYKNNYTFQPLKTERKESTDLLLESEIGNSDICNGRSASSVGLRLEDSGKKSSNHKLRLNELMANA